jgi:hypothetical protein
MSEFAFLFRGRDRTGSPEQLQKTMLKWAAWFKELGVQGHIVDPGHPLQDVGNVVRGKTKAVNDGPFAETKDLVNGYILIEATDLAHATELAKGCPGLEIGGSVEVRPVEKLNM